MINIYFFTICKVHRVSTEKKYMFIISTHLVKMDLHKVTESSIYRMLPKYSPLQLGPLGAHSSKNSSLINK
jgi:hypothetical protein